MQFHLFSFFIQGTITQCYQENNINLREENRKEKLQQTKDFKTTIQETHTHVRIYKSNEYVVKFTSVRSHSFLIPRVSDTVTIYTYFTQQYHNFVFLLVNSRVDE